jgi:uncharacterized protein YuzE
MKGATMEYTYETETDDLYVRVSAAAVARTIEVSERCLVDVDHHGQAVGIEVLGASLGWPVQTVLKRFQLYDIHPLLSELQRLHPVSAVPSGQPALAVKYPDQT